MVRRLSELTDWILPTTANRMKFNTFRGRMSNRRQLATAFREFRDPDRRDGGF
jgi:hypothetical protein